MSQYIAVLIWLGILFLLVHSINLSQNVYFLGEKKRSVKIWFSVLAALPIIYWIAIRPSGVFDTGLYARTYLEMPSSFSSILSTLGDVEKDKGFFVLSSIIHILVGDNTMIYFAIIAIIQVGLLFHFFRKYSYDFWLSIFIFVASTDYLSWLHNGIRQFTAVTIILSATGLLIEKKYFKVLFIIIIASLFHQSALLMIPIIIIADGKPWNIKTLAMLFAVFVAISYVGQFTELLDNMLADTQYTSVVSDWKMWEDNGTNPFRVLVYSIPALLSIVGFRYIKEADNRLINICVNMSIVSSALYIVSMYTSGIFIGRLPIYASLYATCILLPWEIDNMLTPQSAKIAKGGIIIGYLCFYYFQCHMIWGII